MPSSPTAMLSSLRQLVRPHRRGVPAHLGSLLMLLQRSPLLKLLPEARVISTSGFTDALGWSVAVVTGLGAFDAVSGATTVTQITPTAGSRTVNAIGGAGLSFVYSITGAGGHTPGIFEIRGTLPKGLAQTGIRNSKTDSISGVPVQTGSFPITIIAWEYDTFVGRSTSGAFTLVVSNPPAPAITAAPAGGNFSPGNFVSLTATTTHPFSHTWNLDGTALPAGTATLAGTTVPRRYKIPTADPGTVWRSGAAFDDAAWTSVSGGIGYDISTAAVNYLPQIAPTGGNVQSLMYGTGKPTSALIRIPFTPGPQPLTFLKLRVQCDDGFVAWINGTEIARQNKPATLLWNSAASADAVDTAAVAFRTIDISNSLPLLRGGENLLAVQALNRANSSSDFLFNCELTGGVDDTNSRHLILPALTSAQAGGYTLTVTNPTATVTSAVAAVNLPPVISAQPASHDVTFGTAAALSVTAVTSPPFTFQWYRGLSGDTTAPVAGATSNQFTTPALTASDKFWVRVTNAAGSVNSDTASLTVTLLPPEITAGPDPLTLDAGDTAHFSVTPGGTPPLSFQWYRGLSGDTSAPVAGATAADFTTDPLFQSGSYWLRVTNPAGSRDSSVATVTVREPFLTWRNGNFPPATAASEIISGHTADPDGDGSDNDHEYIFGTSPGTGQPPPAPAITRIGSSLQLSFTAVKAAGPGYAGRTRHYAVETTGDVAHGPWTPLPLFADIVANDQQVTATLPAASGHAYSRLRVWLTP